MNNKICAITSYFNPLKSRRRLENYKTFAKKLNIFLVTIELSTEVNKFELTESDADIYVRIVNSSVLWHKESLLNIALGYVPEEMEYVVWVDCDVIFNDSSWMNKLPLYLEKFKLVQLFSDLYDLAEEDKLEDIYRLNAEGLSIAYLNSINSIPEDSFNPKATADMRRTLFGLAWAAKKSLLKKHGFYDAMIVGSGDRAMFCAGLGEFDVVKNNLRLSDLRFRHYLDWAIPFYNSVKGEIGCLKGEIIHLWHGKIKNRKYLERHIEFAKLNFNPYCDITKDANGSWVWNENAGDYELFLKSYFSERQEY